MSEGKENSSKYVKVTTEQYRQLDFLRLFKLCKDLNLFNRKRKMPIEYKSNNSENNDKDARSACRRLLRALIKHIFPESYNVKSNFSNYFVEFPVDMRTALSYINNNAHHLERSTNEEYREAVRGYRLIAMPVGGFVSPRIPYSIKIHFSPDQRRQYRDVRRTALGQGHGDYVWKPAENFYKCAKACVEYKQYWDEFANLIIKVAEKHRAEVEEAARNREKLKKVGAASHARNTPSLNNPQPVVSPQPVIRNAESARVLAEAVAQSAVTGPRNTQESFNRALQDMLARRRQ